MHMRMLMHLHGYAYAYGSRQRPTDHSALVSSFSMHCIVRTQPASSAFLCFDHEEAYVLDLEVEVNAEQRLDWIG